MAFKQTFQLRSLSFDLSEIASSGCLLRLGKLSVRNRQAIDTPHYIAVSSRGCIPHISQDMARNNTSIKGIYVALEDCKWSLSDLGRRALLYRTNERLSWT